MLGNTSYAAEKSLSYDTTNYIYLSDMDYVKEKSFAEPGNSIMYDKNANSGLLSLYVDASKSNGGTPKKFIKGISAWAQSEIVYDLTSVQNKYDFFESYIGVDSSQQDTYYNDGVTFYIYTSNSIDGNWNLKYKSRTFKGWDKSEKIKINLENNKYLKLVANRTGGGWWSSWYDDALYADAKLVKEGYVKPPITSDLKTVEQYTQEIKELKNSGKDYKLKLLQRKFVNNFGYDVLCALTDYTNEYNETLDWLMNNEKVLEEYLLGGTPDRKLFK